MAIKKQNNSHKTLPQTRISLIVPRLMGIVSCHKSVTWNNKGRQRTNPCDKRCLNRKYGHSKSNKFSSTVISVSPPINNSVINSHQLSLVCQQSSRYSQNTPCDNRCFNSKESHSNRNDLSSPVIPVPPPLNDSVINPPQLSLVFQQSYSSSHNTTHELQASSIPGRTSPDPSNTMPPTSTKNISRNLYGCMVDVSKLTPTQRQ